MLSSHVGLAPVSEGWNKGRWVRILMQTMRHPFWREACFGVSEMCTSPTSKDHVCLLSHIRQKWGLLLPEAVLAACIKSHSILSLYFFYAKFQTSVNRTPLKNRCTGEMHPFVFLCCVCFFVTVWGCLSYEFSSQRLLCFPREIYFHERRKLRQITNCETLQSEMLVCCPPP